MEYNYIVKRQRNIIDTTWSPTLAYIVGLITSDGYLRRETPQIGLTSKDEEMVTTFKRLLQLQNRIGRYARGGETDKKYYYIYFKSRTFHDFLQHIGITPAKSKTIRSVLVPDAVFADFLRGLFDGDGTFWTTWDKRWPRSFVYYLGLSSASRPFIDWLKDKLTTLYGVKGYVATGKGAYTIRYVKGDTRVLYNAMYYAERLPYLSRKYHKIQTALEFDEKIKHSISTPR